MCDVIRMPKYCLSSLTVTLLSLQWTCSALNLEQSISCKGDLSFIKYFWFSSQNVKEHEQILSITLKFKCCSLLIALKINFLFWMILQQPKLFLTNPSFTIVIPLEEYLIKKCLCLFSFHLNIPYNSRAE